METGPGVSSSDGETEGSSGVMGMVRVGGASASDWFWDELLAHADTAMSAKQLHNVRKNRPRQVVAANTTASPLR
ncbi:hypothetical protein SSPO_013500 [Streptomyces antimycoticus]|uniref:Uncharacterized protein n=1 Tax=Streptomyces antimycoticus TaxID=68175 RepID=A0A499UE76_9ACTN|nr:hypothetical protein SSPO_013500 [Streptomyces antimycoticus]